MKKRNFILEQSTQPHPNNNVICRSQTLTAYCSPFERNKNTSFNRMPIKCNTRNQIVPDPCKVEHTCILDKISNAPANILQYTAFLLNYFYSNIWPIQRMKRNKTKCFHRIHFHSDALSQTASTYRYPTTEKSQHLIPCVLPLARIRARYMPIIEFTQWNKKFCGRLFQVLNRSLSGSTRLYGWRSCLTLLSHVQ
jgi:hypothetical protein